MRFKISKYILIEYEISFIGSIHFNLKIIILYRKFKGEY